VTMPSGTVTFLFTDIESSTRLWQTDEATMRAALARHDDLLQRSVAHEDGTVFSTMGDGIAAAFASASAAVRAALEAQRLVEAEAWPTATPIRVRMGLHTGDAELRDGDYFGTAVNRAARLMAVGHGGQVLCSAVTAGMVDSEVALLDLGEHRLRDLDRPMHIFQMGGGEFGPLRSLDSLPGNLPEQVTSFVGRDAEVAAAAETLASSRLVTVVGVGGVGKTRLAVHVAAEALPHFADGAWLCELAAVGDAEGAMQVLAATLGVAPRAGLSLEQSVHEFLRTRRLLVVLDNCEYVLAAAGRFAERVLRDCPGVRILATSREGLAVAGEQVQPLRSLDVPDAGHDSPLDSGAVKLFVDRVQAATGRTVDVGDLGSVVEICRRLDGIPLAIELAAARAAVLTPAEIAGLLEERFRLLTGGRRTAVERHKTLRATVDWSYALLSSTEQYVFDRLGVFAGGFDTSATVEVAAEGPIGEWDVRDALVGLATKSMVGAGRGVDGQTRYAMLETLRAYAREHLDAGGDADRCRRRHAAYQARFAERAGPGLRGPDELQWRQRLDAEVDNVRAAVTWAIDSPDDDDHEFAVRIVAALADEVRMNRPAGVGGWAVQALGAADRAAPGLRAAVWAAASQHALAVADYETARQRAMRAISEGPVPDCSAVVLAYMTLSGCEIFERRPAAGIKIIDDAIAQLASIGMEPVSLSALYVTAARLQVGSDLVAARRFASEALDLARQAANPTAVTDALLIVGGASWYLGDGAGARSAIAEAVVHVESGARGPVYPAVLAYAALLHAEDGLADRALGELREVVRALRRTDVPAITAIVVGECANVLLELGEWSTAALFYGVVMGDRMSMASGFAAILTGKADAKLIAARGVLGDDAFDRQVANGSATSSDQVLALATREVDKVIARRRSADADAAPQPAETTLREHDP